jgi:hypothetical protein
MPSGDAICPSASMCVPESTGFTVAWTFTNFSLKGNPLGSGKVSSPMIKVPSRTRSAGTLAAGRVGHWAKKFLDIPPALSVTPKEQSCVGYDNLAKRSLNLCLGDSLPLGRSQDLPQRPSQLQLRNCQDITRRANGCQVESSGLRMVAPVKPISALPILTGTDRVACNSVSSNFAHSFGLGKFFLACQTPMAISPRKVTVTDSGAIHRAIFNHLCGKLGKPKENVAPRSSRVHWGRTVAPSKATSAR